MNKSILQVLLGAGIVAAGAARSAAVVQSSSEVWVGTSATIQGNGGAASKISFFSQRMVRPLQAAGIVSSLQGSVLTDTNSIWTDNQFGTQGQAAYVEFDNGWMADIAGCSAATHSLTLAGSLGGVVLAGNSYRIRQHFTVAGMFGTNNEAGLKSGLNVSEADNILFQIPETQQVVTVFYYDDGSFHGWFDASFAPADKRIIYPEQGVMVRRRPATNLNLYLAGPVKTGTAVVTIDVGYNLVGTLKSTTALTLPALNLYTGNPATGLASGFNVTDSDNLLVVQPNGATATYFYYKDPTFEAWFDASFTLANNVQIQPGTAFFVQRKAHNASFNWTIPAE